MTVSRDPSRQQTPDATVESERTVTASGKRDTQERTGGGQETGVTFLKSFLCYWDHHFSVGSRKCPIEGGFLLNRIFVYILEIRNRMNVLNAFPNYF